MLDSKQIKNLGLRFGRALQITIKSATVFTIEHKSVERPIQQSFLLLNNLLKEVGQFTFGFVDNQVLLNNLLTSDPSLQYLETEFLKRGVAAVTFEPGLTVARYTKVIHVLSVAISTIESAGGFLAFIDQNEVDGVRILPAAKNQKKNAQGDTILETDSESYILSKQVTEDKAPRDFLDSIEALLESGCFAPSIRAQVISNVSAQGVDSNGYGVPVEVPKLMVVRDGETVVPEDQAGGGVGTGSGGTDSGGLAFSAAAGQGGGPGLPGQPGMPGFPSAGGSTGVGYAGSTGANSTASGGLRGAGATTAEALGTGSFLDLLQASVQRSLQEEEGNPEKSYASLARILRNTGVDRILARFPEQRQQELKNVSPERLAAEYIEDTALQLAGEKIKAASSSDHKLLLDEEVVHLLARTLQATHMADRLSQKLTKFIQDFAVPPHIQEKIREELQWTSLNNNKKYTKLMELKRYSNIEFRRFLELAKELVKQRDMDRAVALASHYFEFLDDPSVQIESNELSRVPELIRAIPAAQVGFSSAAVKRLDRALQRADLPEFIHFQAANALTLMAQSIAAFENFQDVLAIGTAMETSYQRDREKHKKCCGAGLARLLPSVAIDRILELFLQQKGDSAWSKAAANLLRYAAPASIENVFKRLIGEEDARKRLSLVRLASQLGNGSIEVAHRYLQDERWYVVRNMCGVLTDLKDPDLVEFVAPALRNDDARVQQAALKALVKSRSGQTASVLAAALSKLAPQVLDEALDELMFLKDASAISDVEEFICKNHGAPASLRKAVQVLGVIQDDLALHALSRICRIEEMDQGIRRAALKAIANHRSPLAATLLKEVAGNWGPLAEEARNELERRK